MKSPLVSIFIRSIYEDKYGLYVPLPKKQALCTPDTYHAITGLETALAKKGGKLALSDLFRTYEMQSRAYLDYIACRKKAFSPAPGGSFHEAGRAFDLDLGAIHIPLEELWVMAAKFGITPVITKPDPGLSEAWHFERRGSHQVIYNYYNAREASRNLTPYLAAAASAIMAIGVNVHIFHTRQLEASIQSCLIRLGKDIGNMDGIVGKKTKAALKELKVKYEDNKKMDILIDLETLVCDKFPGEFSHFGNFARG